MRAKKSGPKKPADSWETLRELIAEYAEAYVADSWKGGGDPADFEVIEARLKLQTALLSAHIEKMERELS